MNTMIRKATPEDISAIQNIAIKTIHANYKSFLDKKSTENFIATNLSDHYIYNNIEWCDVLTLNQTVKGFAFCKKNQINLMVIEDKLHRKGLGSKLLKHCENSMFQNHSKLILETFEHNKKAIQFYEKNGWEQFDENLDVATNKNTLLFTRSRKSPITLILDSL